MGLSVTLIILIVTVGVSITAFNNRELYGKASFSPFQVYHSKEYFRLISHAFVHAGWMHLIVNMYVLYIFGRIAEAYFTIYSGYQGMFHYLLMYLGGIIFATLPSLRKHKDNIMYNSVGASGAVSAVLFSVIVFDPLNSIRFIFIPIDIPAIIFGVLYLFYEAYMDKHSNDYVAHDAHYYGAIFGVLFTFLSTPASFVRFFEQISSVFQ